jgi:hypothetical protein
MISISVKPRTRERGMVGILCRQKPLATLGAGEL